MVSRLLAGRLVFSLALSSLLFLSPTSANAGVLSFVNDFFSGKQAKAEKSTQNNSQNMPILQASVNPDSSFARGGGDITVVGDSALLSDTGPIGTHVDIPDQIGNNGQISLYIVRSGDSLSQIAKMFGVSVNTIIWANDIKGGIIAPGQRLVILPVSGIQHTVKKGDTVGSIAKKYKTDIGEILTFNGLSDGSNLKEGDALIIPDGEQGLSADQRSLTGTTEIRQATPDYKGYYIRPLSYEDGRKTQGIHGYNGVDIGAAMGTAIRAAAEGDVIVARQSGWNGGYGRYMVVQHANGTQTLYGHLSSIAVPEGTYVSQGQVIGFVGNTGKSTGPHLHFEVRGAKNPF